MLRARHTGGALLMIGILCVIQKLLGPAALRLNADESLVVPWAVIVPLLMGTIAAMTSGSGAHTLELGTSRSLKKLRATHLCVVLGAGFLATSVGTSDLVGNLSGPAAIRNFLGFAGLGLVSSSLLGPLLAWPLPMAFGAAALTTGAQQGIVQAWAWPIGDNSSSSAATLALTFAVLGIATMLNLGPKETQTDLQEE